GGRISPEIDLVVNQRSPRNKFNRYKLKSKCTPEAIYPLIFPFTPKATGQDISTIKSTILQSAFIRAWITPQPLDHPGKLAGIIAASWCFIRMSKCDWVIQKRCGRYLRWQLRLLGLTLCC